MKQKGFTVIELLVVAVFLIVAGVVLVFQINKINEEYLNEQKKTAINAIFYSLEEGFFAKNKYYPEHLTEDTLPTMDKSLLRDTNDLMINETGSEYRYEPKDCQDGKCKAYSLRATIEGEDDFVKDSRNK